MVSDGFRWFQVVSGGFRWFQMVSDGFRWFQVVSGGCGECQYFYYQPSETIWNNRRNFADK
jgi:hypothetical protein